MRTVLVVDDEPRISTVLRGYLKAEGFEAADGATALTAMHNRPFRQSSHAAQGFRLPASWTDSVTSWFRSGQARDRNSFSITLVSRVSSPPDSTRHCFRPEAMTANPARFTA